MALARVAGSSRRLTHVFGSLSSSQATSIAPTPSRTERGAATLAAADISRSVQTTVRAVLMADSPWAFRTISPARSLTLGVLWFIAWGGRDRGALPPPPP